MAIYTYKHLTFKGLVMRVVRLINNNPQGLP